jgi:hypothetical protein
VLISQKVKSQGAQRGTTQARTFKPFAWNVVNWKKLQPSIPMTMCYFYGISSARRASAARIDPHVRTGNSTFDR